MDEMVDLDFVYPVVFLPALPGVMRMLAERMIRLVIAICSVGLTSLANI